MANRLGVAFLWHMHQPIYRDSRGRYALPWCYLHALKDYSDMAAHLEQHPEARMTINWTPTLLDQLADYAARLDKALQNPGQAVGDDLLDWLIGRKPLPESHSGRLSLIAAARRANPPTMIHPYAVYHQLTDLAGDLHHGSACKRVLYFNDQLLYDLLVWYHLAWCGAALRQTHPVVQRLLAKGCSFSLEDRLALAEVVRDVIRAIPERYRALAKRAQIELSLTPFAHPIAPLLLDFAAHHEARPGDPLPEENYPGGQERLRWHIEAALKAFEGVFGFRPAGLWPAEGAVCARSLALYAEYGFRWVAAGENTWRRSAEASGWEATLLHTKKGLFAPVAWRETPLRLFFRDDGLSDLIGFQYQHWRAEDAVSHFVAALESIAEAFGDAASQHTVLIALDGENAWEFYPNNGWEFLELLFGRLSYHPRLKLRTISEALEAIPEPLRLTELCAGSWVQGALSTWIGSASKNRAWSALITLKKALDGIWPALDVATQEALRRQLALCEASDWFWWFADHNPAEAVSEFDALFRDQLRAAYRLAGLEPPAELEKPFAAGGYGGAELGGTMQRSQ